MTIDTRTRLSIFPLPGAILFPRMHLPLRIFEPRYRALVSDAMARDRWIGMIQPRMITREESEMPKPPLFETGTVGKIIDVEALDDGGFNIVLQGQMRFHLVRELEVGTTFRQIEARLEPMQENPEALGIAHRAALESASRSFAKRQGYMVDWEQVKRLDDETLVNGIAQIAPFDAAAKQALLETKDLNARSELIIQLMSFFGMHDGDGRVTLQ